MNNENTIKVASVLLTPSILAAADKSTLTDGFCVPFEGITPYSRREAHRAKMKARRAKQNARVSPVNKSPERRENLAKICAYWRSIHAGHGGRFQTKNDRGIDPAARRAARA